MVERMILVTMRQQRSTEAAATARGHTRVLAPDAVAEATARIPDHDTVESISRSLHALGEPARLRIVVALHAAGELSVGDVAVAAGTTEPAASQHLRVLRAERLVRNRRQGRVVFYSLADDHIKEWVELILAHAAHHE